MISGPEPKRNLPAGKKGGDTYVLLLYVAGLGRRSTDAIGRLRKVCDQQLPGRHRLKVIDIYQQPSQAREAQLVAAPTLVKELPLPSVRIVGDFTDEKKLLRSLDIR